MVTIPASSTWTTRGKVVCFVAMCIEKLRTSREESAGFDVDQLFHSQCCVPFDEDAVVFLGLCH